MRRKGYNVEIYQRVTKAANFIFYANVLSLLFDANIIIQKSQLQCRRA